MKLLKAALKNAGKDMTGEWWRFSRSAQALYERATGLERVLVRAEVSDTYAFLFSTLNVVFSNKVIVFALDTFDAFCVLQSSVHEHWARMTSSTMKDDLSYVPADSFDTFAMPAQSPRLGHLGARYYDFRAALMVRNNEGLTKTYNRFHDPDETDPDILKLRELHDAMDRAVLDAYGWTDIRPTCEFLLDYEEPEDESDDGAVRKRKKPWRYRWPDEVRDEVLARLLELNAQRAKEEAAAALTSPAPKGGGKGKPRKSGKGGSNTQGNLF
jgi:hypothetical protein